MAWQWIKVNVKACLDNLRKDVHVIADLKLLDLASLLVDELLDDETADGVAGVALARIRLDDDTAVHPWCVVFFVLRAVVRVDGVSDVGTDQEGPGDRLSQRLWVGGESLKQRRDEGRGCARG